MTSVAVLTICRNDLSGLKKTIASVNMQTRRPDQFVIVDGASTDGTVKFLTEFNHGAQWISESDQGISDAFNKAANLSECDWIIYLNSGDCFSDETVIEEIMPNLESAPPQTGAVCGYVHIVDHLGNKRSELLSLVEDLHTGCSIAHQGAFIRRDLQMACPYDIRFRTGMDYDFWLRVLAFSKLIRIDRKIANCSWGGISTSRKWQERQLIHNQLIRWINSVETPTSKALAVFSLHVIVCKLKFLTKSMLIKLSLIKNENR